MKKEILCTLGPASMNNRVIKQLERLNVSLFRINLSHTKISDVSKTIQFIKDHSSIPICLDTEGAQVRTADNTPKEIQLIENSFIKVSHKYVIGNSTEFNFNPCNIVEQIELGDFINIDFNAALGQVVEKNKDGVVLRILHGGHIGKNKAVTIQRTISLPPLTEKDREAVIIGLNMGLRHFALSFASNASDVDLLRKLAGKSAVIISKIENRSGLTNLNEIAEASDALLIDRGDLSREVPIEKIPVTQKLITTEANKLGVKLYVATNLLESMVNKPSPTRAEVNDVYNTLSQGADGLVLAAETAIGDYPVECAKMIDRIINEYHKDELNPQNQFDLSSHDWLVEPHGGELVQCIANSDDLREIGKSKAVTVDSNIISDCQMIATGVFSPIDGFMDCETLKCVLDENRLPEGVVWTMPIVLPVSKRIADSVSIGEIIKLQSAQGETVATLKLSDKFQYNLNNLAKKWFGTTSLKHPGVKRIDDLGDHFLAGPIKLISNVPYENNLYEINPHQCRSVFAHKNWQHVIGFHTRNVPHRAHEFIMLEALEKTNADGLFINPVIGSKKKGDFLSTAIMKSFKVLLENGFYPKEQAVLGSLFTYSRYAGPREAIFTALCRKNMGCDFFIVGRDHTGVGDFYGEYSSQKLFDAIGDIGITPVYFDTIGFDEKNKKYVSVDSSSNIRTVSGTQFREALLNGEMVPDWHVRTSVQQELLSLLDTGKKIFCE